MFKRLTSGLALVYLVAVALIALLLYGITRQQFYEEAWQNISTLTNVLSRLRTFVRQENTSISIPEGNLDPLHALGAMRFDI